MHRLVTSMRQNARLSGGIPPSRTSEVIKMPAVDQQAVARITN
jgi:hypothetical protein